MNDELNRYQQPGNSFRVLKYVFDRLLSQCEVRLQDKVIYDRTVPLKLDSKISNSVIIN